MPASLSITAAYAFREIPAAELLILKTTLVDFGRTHELRGLVLIATEGINFTVSGSAASIAAWKTMITEKFGVVTFKDAKSEKPVFRRWSIKIKPEIVAIKNGALKPSGTHRHLSPREWQETIDKEDVTIVDTRNDYETAIGMFRGALDPKIRKFSDFPKTLAEAKIAKDAKILTYCTGGIRCEKAVLALEEQGFTNVHQLEGGILAYLEEFPNRDFVGECYVFDRRVAVDQNLRPSQTYSTCPHCGLPGTVTIDCTHCHAEAVVCETCLKNDAAKKTCSTNCAYLVRRTLQIQGPPCTTCTPAHCAVHALV